WPLTKNKLQALNALVEEQLAKGNIVPTNSPWNSLVFVIKKPGKDRWRLLHDLWKINEVIEDMGPLQPGMPSPSMLLQNWKLAVIDIKDCFFQIPLHPDDTPRFAFSVPSINREAPVRRYHWCVLPQGMQNSPTICQWYVALILAPVRAKAEKAVILHYMDDMLVCAHDNNQLTQTLNLTVEALAKEGFELQKDKVHRVAPWKYLGLKITERTITPQQISVRWATTTINDNPCMLRELHQLCGSINWVLPLLGITTEELALLFNLL
ncbi:POK18 protein, partial [Eulacestoma nigropectus]|nr:POK18 protein [Eulacestoma nigropectus]